MALFRSPLAFHLSGHPVKPAPVLGRAANGKVAGILRLGTCGVKSKDTIPSGAVAGWFMRLGWQENLPCLSRKAWDAEASAKPRGT
jgi:hypothetical protein